MITAAEIRKQVKAGIKRFGRYTFEDKGLHEVLDTKPITAALAECTAEEAAAVLKEVRETDPDGEKIVDDLVVNLDHMPEEWFEHVVTVSGAEY